MDNPLSILFPAAAAARRMPHRHLAARTLTIALVSLITVSGCLAIKLYAFGVPSDDELPFTCSLD